MYEFLVPKKENLDGNQVRLMSCGILPISSPGVGAFPGFPGRFVPLLASSVSLWMLLRIRGFSVLEFMNSAQQQPVCYLTFFYYSESISRQDALHTVLNSLYMHTLPKEQASTVQQILFCGVMTLTLLPARPGLHLTDVGLL